MESISYSSETIEELLYQQTGYWLAAGGATLLIYDWLLCLDREFQYIWKSRWSFAKVWFICHRYAMMALVVVMVYGSVKSSSEPSSAEWCKLWDHLIYIGTPVTIAAIQGTLVLRVCALYRKSPYIIAFLGATYLACSAVMLALVFKVMKAVHYSPNLFTSYHSCFRTCDHCTRLRASAYVPLVVIDTVILALTIRQSFVARSQRKAAPILVTFFQDGIMYFIVALAAAFAHILFVVLGEGTMTSWMINFVSQTAHYPTDPPTTTYENHTNALSTIRFASLPGAKDIESVAYDISVGGPSTGPKSRTGGRCDEESHFELKGPGKTGRENSRRGPTKMDPG